MDANHFAERLRNAQINSSPISPIRHEIGIENIDLAYQIQQINTQHRLSEGARIVGKKIGLTSPSVQAQLGVDQPDFGMLFNDKEVLNGQSISIGEIMQPKVEAEIAFILSEDLDMDEISVTDLLSSIDYALASIEIVGSRIENWDIKITDTVADNASASHFVLGHRPVTLDEFDMVNCTMTMTNNGEIVSSGIGKACLGSPLNAAIWLANKMMDMGDPLMAGDILLTGALGPMVNVKAGDFFEATIEGLGSVSVGFTN